jgi:hypothetical protein
MFAWAMLHQRSLYQTKSNQHLVYHASFLDFVQDPQQSSDFCIKERECVLKATGLVSTILG